jgi:hypothetical protein
MPWTKQVWQDGSDVYSISAERMNRIEQGLYDYTNDIAYATIFTSTAITATTEATANPILGAGSAIYDGNPVNVEVWFPVIVVAGITSFTGLLFDGLYATTHYAGLSEIDRGGTTFDKEYYASTQITPSPGSHSFVFKGWVTAGTTTIYGGLSGWAPGYIRIRKA